MSSDKKRAADLPTTEPESKKKKVTPDPQYHPHTILEHVIREIIPTRWMDSSSKRGLYQTVTTDPQDAITKCKEMIAPWVVQYYEDGLLYDHEHLREKAVSHLQFGPGLYIGIMRIPSSSWRRYVGQSINCNLRVHHKHESASYRKSHPSLHYEYHEIAEEIFWLDPAFVPHFVPAGLLNIMELWQALVFRSLQESDLKDMLPGGGRGIADSELGLGANVRNLLGQGLSFTESPDMGYYRFKNSPDPIKQAYFEKMRNRSADRRWWSDRDAKRESLLRGDIYQGTFGPSFGTLERAGEDRMFTIHYAYILFGTTFWRRWDESTIRVKCELAPEGEMHPHCVVRGCYFLVNDPARRLGIRISGIMKCNGEESFCWVNMWGDQTTMRINSLVDFLLDRPTDIGEPRRFLPRNLWVGRPKGIYTSKDLRDGYDYINVLRKHDASFEE